MAADHRVLLLALVLPAQVWAACEVNVYSADFGSYDIFSPVPIDATGGVEVFCEPQALFRITLDAGANGGGVFDPRRMVADDGAALQYNLYLDAGRSRIWGDGTGSTVAYTGSAAPRESVPIYGRIPPRQNLRVGRYTDTVVVTIEW